jgi:hypothetical protein
LASGSFRLFIWVMSSVSTLGAIRMEERTASARRGFAPTPGWLSSPRFDLVFVVATAAIGLTAGIATSFSSAPSSSPTSGSWATTTHRHLHAPLVR